MYMLSLAIKRAVENKDEEGIIEAFHIQKDFLEEHLLKWSPLYLINMKRESRTPLYHDGAELVMEFLLSDILEVYK